MKIYIEKFEIAGTRRVVIRSLSASAGGGASAGGLNGTGAEVRVDGQSVAGIVTAGVLRLRNVESRISSRAMIFLPAVSCRFFISPVGEATPTGEPPNKNAAGFNGKLP